MPVEVMFKRKNHIIRDLDGNVVFEGSYKANLDGKVQEIASINAAKRESRKLQAQHGQGSVRVAA